MLDAPHLYDRPGNPYLGPDGLDWPDNAQRFAALARVGADIAKGAIPGFAPDVVHAHDWQGALAPAYLHYDGGARPGTVLTIHNLAFQGHFPAAVLGELGLPAHAMSIDGVEYFDGVGFLKAGLQFADRITTVSPTYAREIMTPEFGMALDGLLRARAAVVEGIVNGIDDTVWNPATDPNLAQNYSALRIDMRPRNKTALQQRFGLTHELRSAAVRRRLAPDQPEGPRPAARRAARASRPRRAARAARLGRKGARGRLRRRGARPPRARSPARSAMTKRSRTSCRPARTSSSCPRVSSLAGSPSSALCAMARRRSSRASAGSPTRSSTPTTPRSAPASPPACSSRRPTRRRSRYALERALALYRDVATMRRMRLNGMRADVSWRGPAKRYAAIYRALAQVAP